MTKSREYKQDLDGHLLLTNKPWIGLSLFEQYGGITMTIDHLFSASSLGEFPPSAPMYRPIRFKSG